MNFIGYDIETEGDEDGYALQPWRAREGTGRVTLASMWMTGAPPVIVSSGPDVSATLDALRSLGRPVALYNGIFDLAWLYASGHNVRGVMWYDAMLLWKWLANSQSYQFESHDLKSAALNFLPDWDRLEEFVKIKESGTGVDPSDPYWRDRVVLDAQATALVAGEIYPKLSGQQQLSATVQAMGLPTIAASWVNGVLIDVDKIKDSEWPIVKEMMEIEESLGLLEPETKILDDGDPPSFKYVPSKVLRSPQKLAHLIYAKYGLPCSRYSEKTKCPSADKVAMTYLSERDDRVMEIMRWRKLNTIHTKFISGAIKTHEYLGSPLTHSVPRVFSTYTGRMTYSSKLGKGAGAKRIGIPIHQTPREKTVREYTIAPPGCFIVEYDAKGQEMRGMCTMSKDQTMTELFNRPPPRDNGHALTGAAIGGWDFDEFLKAKKEGLEEIAGPHGLYMAGKFINLSKGYRASDRKLRVVARVDYGMEVPLSTVALWSQKYHNLYPGVATYWIQAPRAARARGYAVTLADRRYAITRWGGEDKWTSDSSAINFPIQGMGADERDLAVATISVKFPHMWDRFYFDLHDGMYWAVPYTWPVGYLIDILEALDGIDYGKYWSEAPPVPYVWEGSFGPNWGSKVEFDAGSDRSLTLMEYYTREAKK